MMKSALLWLVAVSALAAMDKRPVRADQPAGPCPVRVIRNVPYFQGADADPGRHRLDLYLPEGKKDFPVLVFVHGGAWVLGDKSVFGWGPGIGRYFAGQGIGVVFPSYRLAPGARYPEQVKDVARAFAWTSQHIAAEGGNPRELFLCGHSAGGHLAALLATDPSYLKTEGLSLSAIKGVISVSGVYQIPALDLSFGLPGLSASAWRSLGGLFTPTGPAKVADKGPPAVAKAKPPAMQGIPLNLFSTVFGSDPKVCAAASPLTYVRPGLPPFLLINAEYDLPLLPQMARDFAKALRSAHDEVQEMVFKGRGHEDVMFLASSAHDPVARAIENFIRRQCDRPTCCGPACTGAR